MLALGSTCPRARMAAGASSCAPWPFIPAPSPLPSRIEPQRLPHLARRAPAAIRDDVGGHRRAAWSVLLVDVLNDALAPIAARQIEIDVGPFPALLREKALEQEIHADRIDRGNPEAV